MAPQAVRSLPGTCYLNWTDLKWDPVPSSPWVVERLATALHRWQGTRYHEGAQVPMGGVDCWRFVSAVADDMRGRPWVKLPRMIADVAMHNPVKARAALRWAMRAHSCRRVFPLLRAGDVVVAGPKGGGPGHAMIASYDKQLWHVVQQNGVSQTGISSFGLDLFGVLRVRGGVWLP